MPYVKNVALLQTCPGGGCHRLNEYMGGGGGGGDVCTTCPTARDGGLRALQGCPREIRKISSRRCCAVLCAPRASTTQQLSSRSTGSKCDATGDAGDPADHVQHISCSEALSHLPVSCGK